MFETDIRRVWGKADIFDIEFIYQGGTRWNASVPPDTKDGVYAVELWAVNAIGEIGHWTGELYMCSGVCCVQIFVKPYQVWFRDRKYKIIIGKECSHVR